MALVNQQTYLIKAVIAYQFKLILLYLGTKTLCSSLFF